MTDKPLTLTERCHGVEMCIYHKHNIVFHTDAVVNGVYNRAQIYQVFLRQCGPFWNFSKCQICQSLSIFPSLYITNYPEKHLVSPEIPWDLKGKYLFTAKLFHRLIVLRKFLRDSSLHLGTLTFENQMEEDLCD